MVSVLPPSLSLPLGAVTIGGSEGAVFENSLVPALKIHPSGDRATGGGLGRTDDVAASAIRPLIFRGPELTEMGRKSGRVSGLPRAKWAGKGLRKSPFPIFGQRRMERRCQHEHKISLKFLTKRYRRHSNLKTSSLPRESLLYSFRPTFHNTKLGTGDRTT